MDDVVDSLRAVVEPGERAATAQRFLVETRELVKQAERLRDEAIRQARHSPTGRPVVTIDELAERVGVRRNVVVEALRGSRAP